MNRFKTLSTFFFLLIISGILLFCINLSQKKLDAMVQEHELHFTGQISNAPPLVVFTTVALGSFRGLIADMLWVRAINLQDQGNYFELVQLANWITELQPQFSGGIVYLGWNMAYNISVTCSSRDDRWRWVMEGIRLLRDKALVYNPTDPVIYKDLAWIFQHKIGDMYDDHNRFYKSKWAKIVQDIITAEPDWALMTTVPRGAKAFMEKYGKDHKLWKILDKAGYKSYTELYDAFLANGNQLPEIVKEAFKINEEPELEKELDASFRSELLYNDLKLDASFIGELHKRYGELDWRVPESQTIYWASMAVKLSGDRIDVNTERLIIYGLANSFKNGRLLMVDTNDFDFTYSVPNLNVCDALLKHYTDLDEKYKKGSSIINARVNFLKDAVERFYVSGKIERAKELYAELVKARPFNYQHLSIDDFVLGETVNTIELAVAEEMLEVINQNLFVGYISAAFGDYDAAQARERLARFAYAKYQSTLPTEEMKRRSGLPPFTTLKLATYAMALQSFPDNARARLQSYASANDPDLKGLNAEEALALAQQRLDEMHAEQQAIGQQDKPPEK